jgi:SAM-dependent methyltransferase
VSDWREHNRRSWDERVATHVASRFYDVEGFKAGRDPLRAFEIEEVGDVTGRSLVHLQCHFGQDTLGWARRGARVAGLDFSEPAVAAARELAADCGLDAEFVAADVYDAVDAFGGRRFDVVYTGFGALVWLPDIARWARVVADLLAPGGFLYLAEFHPFTAIFAWDGLTVEHPFRSPPAGERYDDADGTYTDGEFEPEHKTVYQWTHPLGDVVTALVGAGLRIEFLHEYDFSLFATWPFMERHDDGTYHLPEGYPALPLIYTLRASAPSR